MTYERGGIVFPYLISNLLYFVTGICRTTWSNSSYQEYLQISLRCSSCTYHSPRNCVFTHIHFYKQSNVKCHSYRDNESDETKQIRIYSFNLTILRHNTKNTKISTLIGSLFRDIYEILSEAVYGAKNYADRRDLHNSRNGLLDIRVSCHLKLFMRTMKTLKDCGILKYIKRRTGRMRTRAVNLFDRTSTESGFFFQFTAPQGCQRLELGCRSETAPRNASQYMQGEGSAQTMMCECTISPEQVA